MGDFSQADHDIGIGTEFTVSVENPTVHLVMTVTSMMFVRLMTK